MKRSFNNFILYGMDQRCASVIIWNKHMPCSRGCDKLLKYASRLTVAVKWKPAVLVAAGICIIGCLDFTAADGGCYIFILQWIISHRRYYFLRYSALNTRNTYILS
ncbi:hypothetical protein OPV22_006470 [Ensete ventricosum]|uniref:Uncharacterized protein n=1 Tax=Ensete ventricosum TaxID=4639 RepID=A0AAV8RN65_ENSVE|nr:hypothetical protein OPV22_006470 [Ensete ventricosum]